MNGAPTLGTMDGANVEIVDEVGIDNVFIFGLSADEVINYEQNGGYNPYDIYNNDTSCRRTSSRSDLDPLCSCIIDKIPHDQEIIHISHGLNNR